MSAEGANVQSSRMEVIANNLANVDTVGFKRELAIFQARYAEAIDKGSVLPNKGAIENVGGGILFRETKTDFSQGAIKTTGNPANAAIMGDGFFTVKKGNDTFLTRAGNFQFNSRGEMITQEGYSVLDDGGSPVVLNQDVKDWTIDDSGALRQTGRVQYLGIVKPESNDSLIKQGENLFRTTGRTDQIPLTERRVIPNSLEMSAVQPTNEMTSMIETTRLFEANINMMKTQDQMLGNLIGRMLKA
jgi:flagellar basal-body rod protein FlgF